MSFSDQQYQLLDFGQQEKLERWGNQVVRRTTVSATGRKCQPQRWAKADLSFDLQRQPNRWLGRPPGDWVLDWGTSGLRFELRTTATGQVGVFPEQADNWQWILDSKLDFSRCRALNLFGYTGGTTLALALRGAQVTHVDAAGSAVKWARRNAEISNLIDRPIRWVVEDASRFVRREIKRQRQYDIVIADPPSFGRGPKGETWKFSKHIDGLLHDLNQLLAPHPQMLIFSSHTPGFQAADWQAAVRRNIGQIGGQSGQTMTLRLICDSGRALSSGECFRWQADTGRPKRSVV